MKAATIVITELLIVATWVLGETTNDVSQMIAHMSPTQFTGEVITRNGQGLTGNICVSNGFVTIESEKATNALAASDVTKLIKIGTNHSGGIQWPEKK